MKGVSASTKRLVEKLPREIVHNILLRHYGEWGAWLPRADRPKPTGGGRSESR